MFDRAGTLFKGAVGRKNDAGELPDAQTFFRIASCTKSFTAAMCLVLRDEGALNLDDAITHFVPELRPMLPRSTPVAPTIRMLMSMSGGLAYDDPWADRQEAISALEFREILACGIRFHSVPGSKFEYSNLGYALLGQVIEQVAGLPYCEAVARMIFQPLGLRSTVFDFSELPSSNLAIGYRRAAGEWVRLPFSGPGAFSSIGGAISTPSDIAKWSRWLFAAFDADAKDGDVLSVASRREMQQIACPILPARWIGAACPQGYGFGLGIEEDRRFGRIISHSGGYPGFSAHMRWSIRAGIGVVAFENATYSGAREPATEALEKVLDALPDMHQRSEVPSDVRYLADRLMCLLSDWDSDTADEIFLANLALDRPYRERAFEIEELMGQVGRPNLALAEIVGKDCEAFGHFDLLVPCERGILRCSVRLGPTLPPRVQELAVSCTFGVDGLRGK
ncbi:beta-lactamase family protein [Mesorhizobium sp. M0518]